jgi:hypothetical protein
VWATHLYDSPSSPLSPSSPSRPSPLSDNARTLRVHARRDSIPSSQIFTSSSAPSYNPARSMASMNRSYSRRAESFSVNEDREATVRSTRRRKTSVADDLHSADKASESRKSSLRYFPELRANNKILLAPLKSVLRPPKLAPSAWQLYFTDWIQRQQASNTRKLNVAQAAKEAGQEYACLSSEEKEVFGKDLTS